MTKLKDIVDLKEIVNNRGNKKIVFTNGCFDILHAGHIKILEEAKSQGDILIVALNSDSGVSKIKGFCRPIIPFEERAKILSAIQYVDYIIGFDEETPFNIIKILCPNVLVKGSDWEEGKIVGSDIVKEKGGEIYRVSMYSGKSSSQIIYSILRRYGKEGACNVNNSK